MQLNCTCNGRKLGDKTPWTHTGVLFTAYESQIDVLLVSFPVIYSIGHTTQKAEMETVQFV